MLALSFAAEIGQDLRDKVKPHIHACREEMGISLDLIKNLKNGDLSGDISKARVRISQINYWRILSFGFSFRNSPNAS